MLCGTLGASAGRAVSRGSRLPSCAASGAEITERCGGLSCQGRHSCAGPSIECIVQEVVLQRHAAAAAPALHWLTGMARLLYVEVGFPDSDGPSRQTQTGVLLRDSSSRGCEVWVFGASAAESSGDSRSDEGGDRLVLPEREPAKLVLRVLRSHATWHLALGLHAPLDLVAEGQFGVEGHDRSEIVVPLVHEGHACGEASLVVRRLCNARDERHPWLGGCDEEDTRLYVDGKADEDTSSSE